MTDPDRAAVAGAPVILMSLSSGEQRTGLTDDEGTFRFTGLTPGEYRGDYVYWMSSLGNRQLYPEQPFNVFPTVHVRTN